MANSNSNTFRETLNLNYTKYKLSPEDNQVKSKSSPKNNPNKNEFNFEEKFLSLLANTTTMADLVSFIFARMQPLESETDKEDFLLLKKCIKEIEDNNNHIFNIYKEFINYVKSQNKELEFISLTRKLAYEKYIKDKI
ncbi:MAG: hypothetical protein LBH40_05810 [Alphaproteobacteria bacterium]|nr:hypothetical protein [Alphaproteobacteria bacterium]